jgi:pyruvate/2-oxoglutarate dehydrogenase complex dihydrolipoamide dehydrogenase (E3) component
MMVQSDDTTSSSPLGARTWNGTDEADSKRPLKIVIVGAGIGGLAAAIGLRRAGHNVSVMCYQLLLTYAYLLFLAI